MVVRRFPSVDQANEFGVLAAGGDLEVETLVLAYTSGIFPWPHEGHPLLWFAPQARAILEFDAFHLSPRTRQYFRKSGWQVKVNANFESVIRACATTPRHGQDGTWIIEDLIHAYLRFHHAGYAMSFETYDGDDLIGGVYGVRIGKFFAAESMFYHVSNASKFALSGAVEYLQRHGLRWMDVQVLNPFLVQLGAKEIDRKTFMAKMASSELCF